MLVDLVVPLVTSSVHLEGEEVDSLGAILGEVPLILPMLSKLAFT